MCLPHTHLYLEYNQGRTSYIMYERTTSKYNYTSASALVNSINDVSIITVTCIRSNGVHAYVTAVVCVLLALIHICKYNICEIVSVNKPILT